ncbi:MAG: hypothetical protein A2W26_05210 [Acidobacteria bacterium RBG_16_64_8]|nr:MAG: hypothetical protein A2W26_05210 [Acidobacteria bacterium RBG_16_64_8]
MGGRIKRGEGTLIGDAGEFAVMSELLKQGIMAALAPRNAPWFDILATNGQRTVRIRVKTKSVEYDGWQWNVRKDGAIFSNLSADGDFVVAVDLAGVGQPNRYFIMPTRTVDRWLKDDFAHWVKEPGVRGKPHDPSNKRRILWWRKFGERMTAYRDWGILWKEEPA